MLLPPRPGAWSDASGPDALVSGLLSGDSLSANSRSRGVAAGTPGRASRWGLRLAAACDRVQRQSVCAPARLCRM